MRAGAKVLRRSLAALGAATVAVLPPLDASAQIRAELQGGMTIGSHSASAAALDMDPSVSAGLTVSMDVWRPDFAVFGGYMRTAFGCEEGYCTNVGYTIVGNHGALGVEWAPGRWWMRSGLLLGAVTAGKVGTAPKFGVGILAAAGFTVGTGKVRLKPGASYRWMQASTESESGARALALSLDFGIEYLVRGN